jgi:hypothetical protein
MADNSRLGRRRSLSEAGNMGERPAYLFDYRFRQLKAIATRGGEHDRDYARGVRSVIDQIESTGCFRPNPLLAYLIDLYAFPQLVEAAHDAAGFAAARVFLAQSGWTVEQGYDFARGARLAERELSDYRAPGSDATASAA